MERIIRDVAASDLDAVLSLNQSEVPHVGGIDLQKLQWFTANASYFRIVEAEQGIAAYLVGLRPGTSYASPNYRWFCDHLDNFGYVDRIAIATVYRRSGLASRLYEDFAAALADVPALTCEVNIRPPNETSMQFHHRLGFEQVGTLTSADGEKQVALMALRR